MSAQELITDHLDLWTGAVTKKSTSGRGSNGKIELIGIKKLRELILELAVRGKLVEQDPSEEPAHLILERLDSTVKKSRGKSRASCGTSQPSLPTGWASFRVGDHLDFQYGKSLPAKQRDDSGSIEVYGSNGVVGFHTLALTEEPCIVVGRKGSAGALNKALGPSWTTDVAYYIQPRQGFDFEFTYLLLQSLHLDQLGKGIKPGVNRNEAYALSACLPPLEEQHRIVQKVDELMALCDRLEQQTSDQLEAHELLVDTLLGTLTQSENAAELADNWARLAAHFDTLFTTEQSIDKLKQTILQLAVMGRLVEQDAGDEPATELLKSIQAEKDLLSLSSKQRKTKPLAPISESEVPFSLPSGWVLSRLDDITDIQGGIAKGKKVSGKRTRSLPYLRVANVQRALLDLSEIKEIEIADDEVERYLVNRRDLLITEGGDWDKVGRTAIWDGSIEPMAHQNHVFRARLILDEQNERWLERYLNSQFARNYFASSSKQTTNLASINKTQLRSCTVPLPPLEEQKRIVQKVDELMALCDQLKERLNQASETRCQLAEALVEQAIS
ncbi:restriction endonuclease subunit S [Marinobacterium iners]|uniref:restriction endonuclease subunit S n=1 Tax=Marinobacterium iners TaxID=48076 RepID=UPI001A8CA959|nr:restriction endonuclease subunit S [Marinobacterium iners]QSR34218.1 restriction endonuclease subunit S [Marinobacterium iners]